VQDDEQLNWSASQFLDGVGAKTTSGVKKCRARKKANLARLGGRNRREDAADERQANERRQEKKVSAKADEEG
jgi:hypothetical protein